MTVVASAHPDTRAPHTDGSLLIQQETLQATPDQMQLGCEAARRSVDRLFERYGEELSRIDS